VSFDPAAADYDRTRKLPARAMGRVLDVLRREFGARQPCLEIGVGTGRLALPLTEAGIRMAGIDLSKAMLAKLVEKEGGRVPFPMAVADAARLPFDDATFGSALAMHALHVIGPWRGALEELARVVRPGGVIVADSAVWGSGWAHLIQRRFLEEAGLPVGWPGASSLAEVDEAMVALGAKPRDLPDVLIYPRGTIAQHLARLEGGVYSFTWHVDPATRRAVVEAIRPWAEERFGPLDRPRKGRARLRWRAYDLG